MRPALFLLLGASAFGASSAQLLSKTPFRFEPNRGQSNRSVLWAARGPGYSIGFTRNATLLELGPRTVSMRLPGQDLAAPFEGTAQSSAPTNYLTAAYHGSIPAYGRLRRRGVYPGVDIVYYGNGNQLEYDFEIAAGGDPSRIRMHFDGADYVRLSEKGDLLLQLGDNFLTQHVPAVYQRNASGDRSAVPASYRIHANGDVSVALSDYDSDAPLIIDPVISFTSYIFGTGADSGVAIATDANGFVYVAGNTTSLEYPSTNAAEIFNLGAQDVFVTKLNPNAASGDQIIVYASFYGGTALDRLAGMAVDNGLIYITGSTLSTDLPTARAFSTTNGGGSDVFVALFDSTQSGSASLLYATYLGGAATDDAGGIATLGGKIYITGTTLSDNFPVANAFGPNRNTGSDTFAAEIDPALGGTASLVGSTYFGGAGNDYGRTIAVDTPGHVYISGFTFSHDFPLSGSAYQSSYSGGGDAFLSELFLDRGFGGYSTYLGGSGVDDVRKIVIAPAGRIALVGYTSSSDFPITQTAEQPLLGGPGAVNTFLTVLDIHAASSQQLVYSTYFGGSVADIPSDLKLDSKGRYCFGGYTFSRDLPVSQNALNAKSANAGLDGFVAMIDPSAPPLNALLYSSYITGPGTQTVNGVDVGANGAIYVTGSATADIFPAGFFAHSTGAGNADTFILIFVP